MPKNHVTLLCFHYPPSLEVASRRIVAIGHFLCSRGMAVSVVTAAHEARTEADTAVPTAEARPVIHSIAQPAPLAVTALVRLKRLLHRRPSEGTAHAEIVSGDPASKPAAAAARASVFTALKAGFFRLAHLIDDRKKWAWLAAREVVRIHRRTPIQVIFTSGPPMSTLPAAVWAARRTGAPLILDLRDPWWAPLPSGEERLETRIARRLERFVVHRATAITCTSPGLTQILQSRYPQKSANIHTVMNGYDGEISAQPTATGGRLCMVFAGALYYNRDPFPFLAALQWLLEQPQVEAARIEVIFVGECRSYKGRDVAEYLKGTSAETVVRISPPVPLAEVTALHERATVLLNFAQGQRIQVPAKTFEQMLAQRELLILSERDSDTARIAAQVGNVRVVEPNDNEQLRRTLFDLYRRHAVEGQLQPPDIGDLKQFSRATQNQKLLDIIEKVRTGQG